MLVMLARLARGGMLALVAPLALVGQEDLRTIRQR